MSMTIHFFTKGDINMASSRFRAYFVAEKLRGQGIDARVYALRVQPWWEISYARLRELVRNKARLLRVKKNDIVYAHKTVFQADFILMILFFKLFFRRKIFFDFDDAIFVHSPKKTKLLCRLADKVIVASHFSLDFAKKYNKQTFLIPTSLDARTYQHYTTKYGQNQAVTIGWIGNAKGHYQELKLLVPVLQKLLESGTRFRFTLIGATGSRKVHELFHIPDLEATIVDNLDWSDPRSAPQEIQKFDIGVMPLTDTEFNRGKAAFKAIEYMACGVPVVVSPVGENVYVVQDGMNGFYAGSTDEWVRILHMLISDIDMRKKIGRAGQRTVYEKYSYQANIDKLIRLFD